MLVAEAAEITTAVIVNRRHVRFQFAPIVWRSALPRNKRRLGEQPLATRKLPQREEAKTLAIHSADGEAKFACQRFNVRRPVQHPLAATGWQAQ